MVADRHGQAAARAMLGRGSSWSAVPFFWSRHHDVTIQVVGTLKKWDRLVVRGDLAAREAVVSYWAGPRPLMVATIGRDDLGLSAEALLERGDFAGLERLVL